MTTEITSELITNEANTYFRFLISDIDNARHNIALETYILVADQTGLAVLDALKRAALRGVDTRLMIDGFGTSPWLKTDLKSLQKSGVNVKIFHPLPWRFWQWDMAIIKHTYIKKTLYLFSVLNRRNHRKVCIIDDKIVWLGSFNLTRTHLPVADGGKSWRDTAVRVETRDTTALNAFDRAWYHQHFIFHKHYTRRNSHFRVNDSVRKRRQINRELITKIRSSNDTCWITNPYFIPQPRLLSALKKAARRGVNVRILVPSTSDIFFMPWASSLLYPSLLHAGVHIHEYKARILHAKTIIIDDWSTVGSSNLNSRSLLHDLEIDYVLQKPESITELKQQFMDDCLQSDEVFLHHLQKRNFFLKLIGRFILFLRYWL